MKAFVLIGAMLALSTPVLAEGYSPPPVGLVIDFVSKDKVTGRLNRIDDTIIAGGEDFVLHRIRSYSGLIGFRPDYVDYFAEFAGIHVQYCDGDMPTEKERQALIEAWPLRVGQTINMQYDDINWRYEVLETGEQTIGKDTLKTITVQGADLTDEDFTETMTLARSLNTAIKLDLYDFSIDTATRIYQPEEPFQLTEDMKQELGNCTALLEPTQ